MVIFRFSDLRFLSNLFSATSFSKTPNVQNVILVQLASRLCQKL